MYMYMGEKENTGRWGGRRRKERNGEGRERERERKRKDGREGMEKETKKKRRYDNNNKKERKKSQEGFEPSTSGNPWPVSSH